VQADQLLAATLGGIAAAQAQERSA
jgi:hypothetical protein